MSPGFSVGVRAQRRAARVSHWPPKTSPVVTELLGGRSPRQLTRSQREQILGLMRREMDWSQPLFRQDVLAVVRNEEPPTRRLARLLRTHNTKELSHE